MKLAIIFFLYLLFTGCSKCGECIPKEPKLTFAILLSDTLLHPISSSDSFRVFKYTQNALWDKTAIKDSTYKIKINWYKLNINGTDSFCYAFDIGYQIDRYKNNIEWNDYWLKGTNNSIQIKLSKITLGHSDLPAECDCVDYWFDQVTINDSLDRYKKPILLW